MSLSENIQKVLDEYPRHYVSGGLPEALTGHPVAALVAHTIPDQLKAACKDMSERYLFKGSVGAGNWARLPWIAVFDILVTNTAQEGYYPVYLFCEDFSGVYLSLNQGVTTIQKQYRSQAIEALRTRAQDFQAQLGKDLKNFQLGPIDLKPVQKSKYAAQYEAGNICSVFYRSGEIPSSEGLKTDLLTALQLYDVLTYSDTSTLTVTEDIELQTKDYEDLRKIRFHSRVERNQKLAKKVKQVKKFVCEACEFDFSTFYGKLGEGYIEAHHLTPISQLKNQIVEMDPEKDFAVLCANCHRMIHRYGKTDDIEGFRKILKRQAEKLASSK